MVNIRSQYRKMREMCAENWERSRSKEAGMAIKYLIMRRNIIELSLISSSFLREAGSEPAVPLKRKFD